jgi:hypothetical protein
MISSVLIATSSILYGKTITISDLGLKPNSGQNATPIVRKAIESLKAAGGGKLVFPKGTYDFYEEGSLLTKDSPYVSNNQDDFPKWTAFPIKEMQNLTIEGSGSLFLFHHRMIVFHIEKSKDITLENIAFDFVNPIHTDSTLIAFDADSFTLEFAPGTTYKIDDSGKFSFLIDGDLKADWASYSFEGTTGRSKYRLSQVFNNRLHKSKAEEIKPGTVKFSGKIRSGFKEGDRITLRHNNRNHVGVFIEESIDTALDHITIHHACGMGVVGQRSENITLDDFRVEPRAGSGRISTTMADATHFSGCRGLIKVTDSYFEGMLDDAINVHGTSLRITKIDKAGNSIIARFMHGQSKGFKIASSGDEIRLIDNKTLLPVGNGLYKVKSAENLNVNEVKIIFETTLPETLKVDHAIENITYTPEVIFSGNTVQNNRARGMLFNTPRKCLVENNLVRTSGSAVLVAGDANGWFESGAVGEFWPTIIRNNTFDNCLIDMFQFCRALISIDPVIKQHTPGKTYHRNIVIEGNHFKVFDAPLVFARSVDGLTIKGNTFERSDAFPPWHPNKDAFLFESCLNITIQDNKVKGVLLSNNISLRNTPESELTLDTNSVFKLKSAYPVPGGAAPATCY